MVTDTDKKLDTLIELMSRQHTATPRVAAPAPRPATPMPDSEEEMYQRFKDRLMKEAPGLLRVLATVPEIEVETEVKVIKTDGSSLSGRIALLIAAGWFDSPKTAADARRELKRTGTDPGSNTNRELDRMRNIGFLTDEPEGFQVAPGMKKNIRKS